MYCRMLQGEHSTILSTFIKLPFIFKIFVLSIFERQFYTSFTVHSIFLNLICEGSVVFCLNLICFVSHVFVDDIVLWVY